jgi:hypothetical protein
MDRSLILRRLMPQQRHALGLFRRMNEATKNDIAAYFKLTGRQAYLLCARWLKSGFLAISNASTKGRTYRLADEFELLVQARA